MPAPHHLPQSLVPLRDARVAAGAVLRDYERSAVPLYGTFIRSLMRPLGLAVGRGMVTGYAAMAGRQTAGLVCLARYGGLGRITFLHVRGDLGGGPGGCAGPASGDLLSDLLAAAIRDLRQGEPRCRLIVCEPMVAMPDGPAADALLVQHGLVEVDREVMRVRLGPASARPRARAQARGAGPSRRGQDLELRGWRASDAAAAARVIRLANQGTTDGLIYPELVDPQQVDLAVGGIIRGSCGKFDARASSLLVSVETGEAIGVCLCSRQPEAGSLVSEIAVHPAWQRLGLGAALLDRSLAQLAATGVESASLAVTTGNRRARELYASRGFEPVAAFRSHYWPPEILPGGAGNG